MGIYWTLWVIGWLLVIVTRIILIAVKRGNWDDEYIEDKPIWYQVITIILMCLCIALVGGIANALFIGGMLGASIAEKWFEFILLGAFVGFLPALLTWGVGYFALGIYKESRDWVKGFLGIVFIISIIFWSIPITKYNRNIDYKEEIGISTTQEYDLYYFCNIPVQQVSGSMSGSSFFGTGSASGKISTSEELPYWYDNGSGEGVYNSVSADESKIVFIEDGETPFIRIITYCKQEIKVDNNTGKSTITDETNWQIYEFHLPKEVMQYNIG